MSQNITTQELQEALQKLVEEMGKSIVEYVNNPKTPDTKPAKDALRDSMGLPQK